MIELSDKYQCSGCAACADVCPAHCIQYTHDTLGFIYPAIDAQACVGCGACERVCPVMAENVATLTPKSCFAAWVKDESIHRKSSSGGLGYVLAYEIIKRGGVVYGCSAENPRHICHVRVDEEAELSKLQGSKYVQSDTRGIYRHLKSDIRSGREVLFIGTPCQVAAVKNLFKKSPSNLYTVDIICHGVPSQKMLDEQIDIINHKYDGGEPKEISFRCGPEYRLRLAYPDKTVFDEDVWHVPYYKAFFKGYSFRPSCYRCHYAGSERVGDLSLGDFWGIKNPQKLATQSRHGVSVVMVSTSKGESLLDKVASRLFIQERPVDEAVAGNDQLRHPVKETLRAKFFRTLYPAVSLGKTMIACTADQKFITLLRIIARKYKV